MRHCRARHHRTCRPQSAVADVMMDGVCGRRHRGWCAGAGERKRRKEEPVGERDATEESAKHRHSGMGANSTAALALALALWLWRLWRQRQRRRQPAPWPMGDSGICRRTRVCPAICARICEYDLCRSSQPNVRGFTLRAMCRSGCLSRASCPHLPPPACLTPCRPFPGLSVFFFSGGRSAAGGC